ncbi:MAG TPA: hypothetical protein VEU62_13010 [Bryobacterales bacterium]|nr:hypothetical protein [Bryobacterales bacterium]
MRKGSPRYKLLSRIFPQNRASLGLILAMGFREVERLIPANLK